MIKYQASHTESCRALILFVAAGSLREALAALREAQLPVTAAMFLLACHEIYAQIISEGGNESSEISINEKEALRLPGKNLDEEDLAAVSEYYGEYQRKLAHLCMDAVPALD